MMGTELKIHSGAMMSPTKRGKFVSTLRAGGSPTPADPVGPVGILCA